MTESSQSNLLEVAVILAGAIAFPIWIAWSMRRWYAEFERHQSQHNELLAQNLDKLKRWDRIGCTAGLLYLTLILLPLLILQQPIGIVFGLCAAAPCAPVLTALVVLDTGFYYYNGPFGPRIFTGSSAKVVGLGCLAIGILLALPLLWLAAGLITIVRR